MPPAARLNDLHTCPMQTPGVPPIPHVGGPITGPGSPTVLIFGASLLREASAWLAVIVSVHAVLCALRRRKAVAIGLLLYRAGILRTRIQDQMIDALNPEKKYPSSWYWRNKLSFKYNLKEFDPYIYTEIFCPLNGPDAMIINNVRLAAGCDYSITKKHTLNFYYLINKEVNVSNPVTTFITGIEYTYSF